MIKRYLSAILVSQALAFLALSGCSGGKGEAAAGAGGRIVAASFYPVYIAALNVTENVPGVRAVNMTPPTAGCLHDYQMTAADAALLERASVLIINGGGAEAFLDKAASANRGLTVVNAGEGLEFISGGHRHKNDAADTNAHVWMSLGGHIRQINNIAERLAAWDTVNANIYIDNARRYAAELARLRESAVADLSPAADRKIAISHDGFLYLALDLGLTVAAVVEREPGVEPGAADVINAVNALKREKPAAIFTEQARLSPAARTVSAETGVPVFELDMIVSGPDSKDAYVRAMEKNVSALKKALGR